MKRSFTVGSPAEFRRSFTGSSMFSGISDIMKYEPVEVFDFKTPTMDFKNQEEGEAILVPVNEVSNIKKEVTNDNLKKIEKSQNLLFEISLFYDVGVKR